MLSLRDLQLRFVAPRCTMQRCHRERASLRGVPSAASAHRRVPQQPARRFHQALSLEFPVVEKLVGQNSSVGPQSTSSCSIRRGPAICTHVGAPFADYLTCAFRRWGVRLAARRCARSNGRSRQCSIAPDHPSSIPAARLEWNSADYGYEDLVFDSAPRRASSSHAIRRARSGKAISRSAPEKHSIWLDAGADQCCFVRREERRAASAARLQISRSPACWRAARRSASRRTRRSPSIRNSTSARAALSHARRRIRTLGRHRRLTKPLSGDFDEQATRFRQSARRAGRGLDHLRSLLLLGTRCG